MFCWSLNPWDSIGAYVRDVQTVYEGTTNGLLPLEIMTVIPLVSLKHQVQISNCSAMPNVTNAANSANQNFIQRINALKQGSDESRGSF